jgi:hypothetical protein
MDKLITTILLFTLFCFVNLFAQDTSQPQQQPGQTQQDQVLDLGEIKIDARVELPQVQILDQRVQPDFEDVRAEKSFQAELAGSSEQLQFTAITSGKVTKIKDIKALLDKKRF